MKTTLRRQVNHRVRYYTIELIPNLFGEWMLIRTYGSINRAKPTGVINEIFTTSKEAVASMDTIVRHKQKRGYL